MMRSNMEKMVQGRSTGRRRRRRKKRRRTNRREIQETNLQERKLALMALIEKERGRQDIEEEEE